MPDDMTRGQRAALPSKSREICHCGHERRLHDPCSECRCPYFRPMARVRAKTYAVRAGTESPDPMPHELEREANAPDRRRKTVN